MLLFYFFFGGEFFALAGFFVSEISEKLPTKKEYIYSRKLESIILCASWYWSAYACSSNFFRLEFLFRKIFKVISCVF